MTINYTPLEDLTRPLIEALFEPQTELKRFCYNPLDKTVNEKLNLETLKTIKESYGDIVKGSTIPNNDNRFSFARNYPEIKLIANELGNQVGGEWHSSGLFWYPPNGYCGWHTNSNQVGKRLYLAYADEDNESFFRYYDAEKDEVVTEWDKKGLNFHTFEVNADKPCWHCVGSLNTNRISIGFRQTL